ncbi:MAG: STAS domain-containing protein [Leptospiraceae bacterium]|nr:STAS domain-containing protein [Leptospiraceae bacterium]MCP5494145.1 STAS domain-containing protein [Leptospiraceae bacterium]
MNLKSEIQNKFTIIHLEGRMDVHYVQNIEEEYLSLINNVGTSNLIINLEKVDFISSSALRIFVTTLKYCKERKIRLILTGVRNPVKKIFELVEMNSMFEISESLKTAMLI